ncbi:MAG: DUF1295 domain-containing protein [Candidatus Dojkabacteria bacterium]|nr:DUF1295 domain-containing protein [Candidatus Dojkabacteria bacterium]
MNAFIDTLIVSSYAVFIFMSYFYFVGHFLKNNGIVDVAWGLGFMLIGSVALFFNGNYNFLNILLVLMTVVWGLRLTLHLGTRNLKKVKTEAWRYKKWRDNWSFFELRAFLQIYMLQGFLMLLISTPMLLVQTYNKDSNHNLYIIAGVLIWLIGLFFETIGDFQLRQFISIKEKYSNRPNFPKIMKYGVWSLTRHPNYFGEATLWWGFFLATIGTDNWYFGIIAPIYYYLLATICIWSSNA